MKALFRRLDVDYVQWRALVGAALKSDFTTMARGERGTRSRTVSGIGFLALIYVLAGLSPAVVVGASADVLLGATVMVTMVAFMVASSLLVGEGTTILVPNDHHVLGFRPVTSRTYLAVRMASLLARTMIIATCVAMPPVIVLLRKGGIHPGRAAAALLAAYAAGIAATLAITAMYGWLLRLAGPARMTRYASYAQLAAQLVVWGGFIVVTQDMMKQQLAGLSLSGSIWALLYPGAWFGSWVEIGSGTAGAHTIPPFVLSLLLLAVLWRLIAGKLSLGYAESVGRMAAAATRTTRVTRHAGWLRLLDDESRAMALLVRSHMQHDMKFRLGVISLIPITLVYIAIGGWPADPFVPSAARAGNAPMIQMALLFLPVTLRRVLVTSERWQASWVFLAAPADHAKLVLAARNIIALFFLLPYLVFLTVLFMWSFDSPTHAVVHAVFMGMVSYLALQFMVLALPKLPFSMPIEKDAQSGAMFIIMMAVIIVGMAAYWLLTTIIYRSTGAMIGAAIGFAVLGWLMDRLTRRRVRSPVWRLNATGGA